VDEARRLFVASHASVSAAPGGTIAILILRRQSDALTSRGRFGVRRHAASPPLVARGACAMACDSAYRRIRRRS